MKYFILHNNSEKASSWKYEIYCSFDCKILWPIQKWIDYHPLHFLANKIYNEGKIMLLALTRNYFFLPILLLVFDSFARWVNKNKHKNLLSLFVTLGSFFLLLARQIFHFICIKVITRTYFLEVLFWREMDGVSLHLLYL